mgnify:CR=1 FL=1
MLSVGLRSAYWYEPMGCLQAANFEGGSTVKELREIFSPDDVEMLISALSRNIGALVDLAVEAARGGSDERAVWEDVERCERLQRFLKSV